MSARTLICEEDPDFFAQRINEPGLRKVLSNPEDPCNACAVAEAMRVVEGCEKSDVPASLIALRTFFGADNVRCCVPKSLLLVKFVRAGYCVEGGDATLCRGGEFDDCAQPSVYARAVDAVAVAEFSARSCCCLDSREDFSKMPALLGWSECDLDAALGVAPGQTWLRLRREVLGCKPQQWAT